MSSKSEQLLLSRNKLKETSDQLDRISNHTQKGISFLEQYSNFVKQRCQLELNYARGLKKLVKSHLANKKDCDDDLQFTSVKAFRDVLSETADMAGQHKEISKTLTSEILGEITSLITKLKEDKKQHLADGNRVQQQLSQSLQKLEKVKLNYEKSFTKAEKEEENYREADADLSLSRAEVDQQRMNASKKREQYEDSKKKYADQLQETNQIQRDHYKTDIPNIFTNLQNLDENRIANFKILLKRSVEIERSVFPMMNKYLDDIVCAADSIDEKSDSQVVAERYNSRFTRPFSIPFVDLGTPGQNEDTTTPTLRHSIRQDTIKYRDTTSTSTLRRRSGLFSIFGSIRKTFAFSKNEDFSDLPPDQRKEQIQQRINEVTNEFHQENVARDGLLKMKEVCEGNPSIGDRVSVTDQLNDSCNKIEKLQDDLQRYQTMLDDDGDVKTSDGPVSRGPTTTNPSLTRSRTSFTDDDWSDTEYDYDESYADAPLPVIGTCRAIYDFDATSEDYISVTKGEKLNVLIVYEEFGWTRVRKTPFLEEGLVPTSYIEMITV